MELNLALIIVLLVAHFVGDFICQTNWMALHKSKRWDALALHVAVYMAVVSVFVALSQPDSEYPYTSVKLLAIWWVVNGAAHFVQDAITSRINARFWFFKMAPGIWAQEEHTYPKHGRTLVNPFVAEGGNRHWFFVGIGFDQLLHYVTLFVTASWWLQ